MEATVRQWTQSRLTSLRILASASSASEAAAALVSDPTLTAARHALQIQLEALLEQDEAFHRLAFFDHEGRVLAATSAVDAPSEEITAILEAEPGVHVRSLDPSVERGILVTQRLTSSEGNSVGLLVGWIEPSALSAQLRVPSEIGGGSEIYLVDGSGAALPQMAAVDSIGIETALSGEEQQGLYENYAGVPVIGCYRWISDLKLALVAEQSQEEAFAATDNVTAAIVGASLLVALVTAVIAAVVTRQITRPVVRLTESALNIAEGDLAQRVPVTSRDEIGILAYVFNRMASELKSLYDDLEAKVAQRTAMLQRANYQIQRRAIQLAATVEVSQAATSILDPAALLERVVRLVHDRFGYSYVGVYLLEESIEGEERYLCLREGTGGGQAVESAKTELVSLGEALEQPGQLKNRKHEASENVGRAIREAMLTGEPSLVSWKSKRAEELFSSPHIRTEAALPLKMGDEAIGVLDILDTETESLDEDAISVLQNVANQITIALENARIYEKEKETAKRLRQTETFRSRFLAHMSHELREPLTNIIGFSRLILKGLDGPISDRQRKDLHIIHANSQHLLGLINDLLDVSQIEAGMMELDFQEFDLSDVIDSVMATTSALVRDKNITLRQDIDDLPAVKADVKRVRQVLLKLLTNAAKFTERGDISVRAWPRDHEVLVSISDTGKGISPEDQQRIFERFEQGELGNGRRPNGAGLGLALSREFVEMHGGEIWVDSTVGEGATFTFSLPLEPKQGEVPEVEATESKGEGA
jgi:signal transduction histidine kinase